MNIILIIYLVFILIWLAGVGVVALHVFKYRIPGDVTTRAFYIFLVLAAVSLLYVIYFISGTNWEVLV
jgi:hypothetical protein